MSAFTRETEVVKSFGSPLPSYDPHAVSVNLPLWEHVIGYEEGNPAVIKNMLTGYPRFRFHNTVQGLQLLFVTLFQWERSHFKKEETIIQVFGDEIFQTVDSALRNVIPNDPKFHSYIFPSLAVGRRFEAFMAYNNLKEEGAGSHEVHLYHLKTTSKVIALFPKEGAVKAKKYWQHSGEIITSRQAERTLTRLIEEELIEITILKNSTGSTHSTKYLLTNLLILPTKDLSFALSFPTGAIEKIWSSIPSKASLTTEQLQAELPYHLDDDFDEDSLALIKSRIATVINYGQTASKPIQVEDILISSTGMSAIFSAFRLAQQAYYHHAAVTVKPVFVMFGYPYLDTYKVLLRPEWNEGGVHFFGHGNEEDLVKLEELLASQQLSTTSPSTESPLFSNQIAAIFTEFPTNPLIKCANLVKLSELARRYGVLLVVDDTIGNFANINLLSHSEVKVDILVTSLTKIFNGASNLMAGGLIVNPNSSQDRYDVLLSLLKSLLKENDFPLLPKYDAVTLEYNSRSFLVRSHIVNRNSYALAQWLSKHPYVRQTFHSSLNGNEEHYDRLKRGPIPFSLLRETFTENDAFYSDLLTKTASIQEHHEAGYGCLLSFELKPEIDVKIFHDVIQLNKGPSLGTNFTLISPYTLMAHYYELAWANQYGVPSYLIRVSVGLEDTEDLIRRFDEAIQEAVKQASLK